MAHGNSVAKEGKAIWRENKVVNFPKEKQKEEVWRSTKSSDKDWKEDQVNINGERN